jgi:hypothetical protein
MAVLIGFVFAAALPVGAQDTTIGLTVAVEPEAPYFGAPADFTITVEANGGALSEVTVQIEHDCNVAVGPIEVTGNGDDILEPGERWEYTCHTDFVFHGVVLVTVTGNDDSGGEVSEWSMFDYGAPFPFSIEVATPTPEVIEGDEVIWEVLVGNDGPYAIIGVDGDARLNRSGPYSPMEGPVEKNGNGDDVLDPGELWEYSYTAVLWQDSFVEVSISGDPEHSPGTHFGSHAESDVVTVVPGPPSPGSVSPGSVVLFDPDDVEVFVVDVNAAGDGFTAAVTSGPGLWASADTVETAYLGGPITGVDDILFYSSVSGQFQFSWVSEPDEWGHRYLIVFADVVGTRGWTHVVTGDYNGDGATDVLFYRASDGLMRFYTTSATGRFIPMTPAYYGTRGWTHLVVGDYNSDGSDEVMWYRARDGLMRFYEVTTTGEFRAITPAHYGTRNWTTIPAGDYDGNGSDDVLFYRADGVARFYEVDANGTFRALGTAFNPSRGFTQIEAVEFTPTTVGVDLAWYHAGHDFLAATRYNVNGVLNFWTPQSTASYGNDLIIATGNFLAKDFPG